MKYSNLIIDSYDFFLYFLKFSVRNNSNPRFRDFSLVSNYLNMICDFEIFINRSRKNVEKEIETSLSLEDIYKVVFKKDYPEYHAYIDTEEKIKLIKKFRIVMHIFNVVTERSVEEEETSGFGYDWIKQIYFELMKIKNNFLPILKLINEEKIKKSLKNL